MDIQASVWNLTGMNAENKWSWLSIGAIERLAKANSSCRSVIASSSVNNKVQCFIRKIMFMLLSVTSDMLLLAASGRILL